VQFLKLPPWLIAQQWGALLAALLHTSKRTDVNSITLASDALE
jgi:hypothetical protein